MFETKADHYANDAPDETASDPTVITPSPGTGEPGWSPRPMTFKCP